MDIWIEMPNLSCLRHARFRGAFQNKMHETGLVQKILNEIVLKSITNVTGMALLDHTFTILSPRSQKSPERSQHHFPWKGQLWGGAGWDGCRLRG